MGDILSAGYPMLGSSLHYQLACYNRATSRVVCLLLPPAFDADINTPIMDDIACHCSSAHLSG